MGPTSIILKFIVKNLSPVQLYFLGFGFAALLPAVWLSVAFFRHKLSKINLWLPLAFMLSLILLASFSWGCSCCGCNIIPPPPPLHFRHHNVSVYYQFPCIAPDGTNAYFIKVVAQEHTFMNYHHALLFDTTKTNYWYVDKKADWYKVYICRGDCAGLKPEVVTEIPNASFPDSPHTIPQVPTKEFERDFNADNLLNADINYLQNIFPAIFNTSGISHLDASWPQQKIILTLGRATNSIEILDLKTGVWQGHTIYNPLHPEWGGCSPSSMQFISNGTVLLISLQGKILMTIDAVGRENIQSIGGDALLPFWDEEHKTIVEPGGGHYLLFDANLVFQQTIQESDVYRRIGRKFDERYDWIRKLDFIVRHRPRQSDVFQLKSHTLLDSKISPTNAPSLW